MRIIVAVDEKWGIGKDNRLLFSVKEDMRHFIAHTKGKTVIMGSNTLCSMPGGLPLKNRRNIVLSRKLSDKDIQAFAAEGYDCTLARSISDLPGLLAADEKASSDGVYVIGGAAVYAELLPFSSDAVVTKFFADGGAELFFTDLDVAESWKRTEESEIFEGVDTVSGKTVKYQFCVYANTHVNKIRR
ncbi:MAG: dihydrofolate reductase [Clostridiaceae bacterium]|jgi:dihydrofolate reductase|nr:dihydrofolate reductase [Clostridiaceae bacterium]